MSQFLKACQHCRYFGPMDQEEEVVATRLGFCYRHAPRPALQAPAGVLCKDGSFIYPVWEVRWPAVLLHDWCGEFQPAREQSANTAPAVTPDE